MIWLEPNCGELAREERGLRLRGAAGRHAAVAEARKPSDEQTSRVAREVSTDRRHPYPANGIPKMPRRPKNLSRNPTESFA